MKRFEWIAHNERWCSACKHLRPRLGCPIQELMEKDPEDFMANQIMARLGRCSQFEKKDPPKKPEKKGRSKR